MAAFQFVTFCVFDFAAKCAQHASDCINFTEQYGCLVFIEVPKISGEH